MTEPSCLSNTTMTNGPRPASLAREPCDANASSTMVAALTLPAGRSSRAFVSTPANNTTRRSSSATRMSLPASALIDSARRDRALQDRSAAEAGASPTSMTQRSCQTARSATRSDSSVATDINQPFVDELVDQPRELLLDLSGFDVELREQTCADRVNAEAFADQFPDANAGRVQLEDAVRAQVHQH